MKRIAILGSTGSIGTQTLEIVAAHPDIFEVVGLCARTRIDRLAEQSARFHPKLVSVWEAESARRLAHQLNGSPGVTQGLEGLIEVATHPDVDLVVIASSSRETLVPLIRAIEAGKRIALASKELLVMAGSLITRLVRLHRTSLLPLDSEHVAVFQCLQGIPRTQVRRILLTGSGGPLLALTPAQMETVSREQVLAHPKWRMGPKITVDSATLMNKGLEVIEARWLFEMPLDQLGVVIHPEAVLHALVETIDGTLLAQLSVCDMRLPIQYALSFPDRLPSPCAPLTIDQLSGLHFLEPDLERFPCLRLALEAAQAGESACVVLNAADEVAVHSYLEGGMSFADIPRVIEETLAHYPVRTLGSLEEILELDTEARKTAQSLLHGSTHLTRSP